MQINRRSFFAATGLTAASLAFQNGQDLSAREQSKSGKILFDLGLASYSFRKFTNDKVISMMKRANLKYISLKDFHLPLKASDEECAKIAKMYADAGIRVTSCGVIYMRTPEEVVNAFRYAKALGCILIIGVPTYDLLPMAEKMANATGIMLAIHNHGPGDKLYPSADVVYDKVKNLSPKVGMALDLGHQIRNGIDPAEMIRKYAERVLDFHIKDMNYAEAKGHCVICGRGVVDFPAVIQALVDIKFDRFAEFEYEAEADDPLPGLMESLGYIRGICRTF